MTASPGVTQVIHHGPFCWCVQHFCCQVQLSHGDGWPLVNEFQSVFQSALFEPCSY